MERLARWRDSPAQCGPTRLQPVTRRRYRGVREPAAASGVNRNGPRPRLRCGARGRRVPPSSIPVNRPVLPEPRPAFAAGSGSKTLNEMEAEGSVTIHAAAIRLLMLTGCRRNEIVALHWRQVDIEAGEIRLADAKTRSRLVPLSPVVKRPHTRSGPSSASAHPPIPERGSSQYYCCASLGGCAASPSLDARSTCSRVTLNTDGHPRSEEER